ncbi:Acyl transferase/acyl hydrolase/lysophospholipase [Penicillium expansum]|uniref:Acyl transferase/acyl hydrolase/lysophospholipase n=1 Tax=Penicillium expansum TaxID=27334 RepID=A0A0A2J7T3_PENEN|nr:Acyl transferase/acyl hydrolase/lysophospholipase [Penicillium expansum]KGO50821.1 Acyl transferase/acyl hydrolase/lysophospholipase [Penicillium expansum]
MQSQATKTDSEPNSIDTKGLCLLSLDGGGVRGLSTLFILKNIMAGVNRQRQKSSLPAVKPCEIFDLIGGTSTGGLIAIMLGRLEMDVDECITAYVDLMRTVFENASNFLPFSFTGKIKPKFNSGKLRDAITKVVERHDGSKTGLLNDRKEGGCKVFVCATAKETTGVTRLRSYSSEGLDIHATISEAALATSAATGFFKSVSIGKRLFVDGALGANNPVDEVEGEASDIWCPDTRQLKPLVKCFISIGTGIPSKKQIQDDKILKFFIKTLVGISTETEQTERKFIARWAKQVEENRFFRFNVEQGLQGINLAEYSAQGLIEAATDEYIRHQNQMSRVRNCVWNLKQKEYGTSSEEARKFTLAKEIQEFEDKVRLREPADYENTSMKEEPAFRTPFNNIPFPRNAGFVGRGDQLSEVEHMLFSPDEQRKVAITGLGGVGKTQVAIEIAYRAQARRGECSIFWISATSSETLERTYLQIAQDLRLPGLEDQQADAKTLLRDYLNDRNVGQWLLIYDNADDIDMWFDEATSNTEPQGLSNYVPWNSSGSVLFTTRFKKVALKLAMANVIELPHMDKQMAEKLLSKRLSTPALLDDKDATILLLEQLTFLPLAIVQAASYINENSLAALSDYLLLLSEQESDLIDLLSEEFHDDWRTRDTKNPVATTWLISFERIQSTSSLAAEILSFMACIEPIGIPKSLLPQVLSKRKWMEAIGVLKAYSFVSDRSENETFNLHRLVHLAMRNWLKRDGKLSDWTTKTLTRLEGVFPEDDYRNRDVWSAYMPHALILIKSADPKGSDKSHKLLQKVSQCLLADGRVREAVFWLEQKDNWEGKNLEREHPGRLASRHELAKAYQANGQIIKAVELLEDVVTVEERTLAKEHPDRLASRHALAGAYQANGQISEAIELLEEVVTVKECTLAKEHPDRLVSRHELARAYQANGQIIKAVELLEEVVTVQERTLAKEHPRRLASQHELAGAYLANGQISKAIELLDEVVTVQERTLAKEHPDRLASRHELARAYLSNGQIIKAVELLEEIVTVEERNLAKEHPDRLASRHELARAYLANGQISKAIELLEEVVAVRECTMTEDHSDRLVSRHALEVAYSQRAYNRERESTGSSQSKVESDR